ncbi:MAG: DUF11 domain-containing protein [Robiginitomaculum sp.]|nr:DUF11 domain-containing protein [Robiginitomaculum sp.]
MTNKHGCRANPVKNRLRVSLAASAVFGFLFASAAGATEINCNGRLVTQLEFSNSVLISGTALQTNSIYQFVNVAPGVDAQVQILGFTGGASLNFLDRDTGLINSFQPELNAVQNSSADFRISFFAAGTATPIAVDFAASGIDIDGNNNNIREYVEFETTLVESLLSNPTLLDTNASGPSAGDRVRFESRTTLVAPGIDETATANIVTVFYTDATSIEYRIGSLDTGTQTRLTSLGFNCPNLQNPITNSQIDEDFGDAPIIYGNPIHTLTNGIRLGATNTADIGAFNDPAAAGDGGDDGIILPVFIENQSTTITANVTGNGGYLQGWIDWNGDLDFNDPGERIATDLQDTDLNGIIDIPVTVPDNPTASATFARFRWSTIAGIQSNTAVGDGEVEDYQVAPITLVPTVNISAVKSVEVFDPGALGLYMVPGNEILYTITVINGAASEASASGIDLTDILPDNLEFISATTTGFTGGNFDTPDLPAINTDCAAGVCIIRFHGANLAINTTGEIIIRALIK